MSAAASDLISLITGACAGILLIILAGRAIGRAHDHRARLERLADLDDDTVDPHWTALRQTMPGVTDGTEEGK